MTNRTAIIAVTCVVLTCSSSLLYAASVTFPDNEWNFPGYAWTNGSIQDEVGTPKIDSLSVQWHDTSGFLETVTVALRTSQFQSFDSLFINVDYEPNVDGSLNSDSWDNWDYFVHAGGTDNLVYNNNPTTSGSLPGDGLYRVNDQESYLYTTNISGGRTDHPNGLDSRSLTLVDPAFTRQFDASNNTLIYDFTGLNIELTDAFSLAYAPWCANDVALGTYVGDPVPEPATMLLFGTGLLGVAGLRRKKK